MNISKAVTKGYSLKTATGGATAALTGSKAVGEAVKGVKGLADTAISAGRLGADTIKSVAPYALAGPPILGLMLGYGISQATSPTGEDITEAQKHLEEQALLQFEADLERNKKARELLQKKLLGRAGKKKEREIRL